MQHKTHWKSIGFSCDLNLEHFSEVLFPVTTPKLWVGDERESRVLHNTRHRTRWWFRKFFLLAKYGFGLWPQWNNLCLICAWLTKSVRVTEGRMEPPSVFALFGVSIAGCGPPQAQGDLAKLASLWAAATSYSFGRQTKMPLDVVKCWFEFSLNCSSAYFTCHWFI